VVPEKQGLKLQRIRDMGTVAMGLSSGSRKTRIETMMAKSKRKGYLRSKQWFQKNKD